MFTVIAYDTDAMQQLCFYINAESKEFALEKLRNSVYFDQDLSVFGITEGEITFSNVTGHSSFLIERL